MTDPLHAAQASQRVRDAIGRMRSRTPELTNIFDAFEDLFATRASLKGELPVPQAPPVSADALSYGQGVPLLTKEMFAMPPELLKKCSEQIIPAMEKGFPGIDSELRIIRDAIQSAPSSEQGMLNKLQTGTEEELEELAAKLAIRRPVLELVTIQIMKPYAEKLAETLPVLPEEFQWAKGYCPVCGSWPEIGFVEEKEGYRNLRCSFCSHQWRFMRIQCPFCETTDQEKLELYYADDRPTERIELCDECKRYLVSLDLREQVEEVVREVAPLGLVHLDILAQERGFLPGAVCAWNLVSG